MIRALRFEEAPQGELSENALVGGTRQRRFDGVRWKPRRVPENAETPTSRVHAVLGGLTECKIHWLTKKDFFMAHNVRCPTFESLF